jgi:hypothetical protein
MPHQTTNSEAPPGLLFPSKDRDMPKVSRVLSKDRRTPIHHGCYPPSVDRFTNNRSLPKNAEIWNNPSSPPKYGGQMDSLDFSRNPSFEAQISALRGSSGQHPESFDFDDLFTYSIPNHPSGDSSTTAQMLTAVHTPISAQHKNSTSITRTRPIMIPKRALTYNTHIPAKPSMRLDQPEPESHKHRTISCPKHALLPAFSSPKRPRHTHKSQEGKVTEVITTEVDDKVTVVIRIRKSVSLVVRVEVG